MSRVYIAVPVDPDHAAEALASIAKAHRESPVEAAERGYTGPPRILRLRDRTGPSVAERLATAEERLDSHRERLAAVEDFTTELRAAEETIVHRIGNLEGGILDHRTRIGDLEREPAPVRPEPGSVADPDRLAKVAHEATDEELGQRVRAEYWGSDEAPGAWGELREWQRADYTRAGKALYNLGREHGRADADAAIDMLRSKTRPSAPEPIVHVPIESAGADGARIQSEAEMAADLLVEGWRHTQRWGWVAPGDGNTTIWTTADAHAAMRAAKGAHPDLFEALKRSLEPSLSEKEAFLRSKGWTDEGPYGWHCPGVEGTSDTHKAYALAKGAK